MRVNGTTHWWMSGTCCCTPRVTPCHPLTPFSSPVQVISPTPATGVVEVVEGLHLVQEKTYTVPTVLIAEQVGEQGGRGGGRGKG